MTQFNVLKGAALGKAITGQGKAIATFTAREHQLAYSALAHLDEHNDAKYLNALYAVTPANYRGGLRAWVLAFGKASFEADNNEFAYAKGKKSDLEKAMEIAPANYAKEAKGGKAEQPFDEIEYLEKALKRLQDKGATIQTIKAMEGVVRVAKGTALTVIKAEKAASLPKAEKQLALPVAAAA
ncbi:hypothetical protein ABE527_02385 [Brucella sp. TWI432]